MKILFDGFGITHHVGNSLGSYTNEIISLINNTEDEIDFNVLLYNIDKPTSDLSFKNVTPLYLNIDRSIYPSPNINTVINRYEIDLYHDPNNGFLAPEEPINNYIVSLNTLLPYLEPTLVDDKFKRSFYKRVPYALEICKYLLVPTKAFKEDVLRTFPKMKDKIICSYPKINEIFSPKDTLESSKFILNNYNINSPFLLYVGDISKRKSIEKLIYILKNLASTPLKLVLIGDYKKKKYAYYRHILELASSLSLEDKIIFLGKIPQHNLPYFYSNALCTIDFSIYNSYPLSSVEAVHCKSVVIVNDTPSNKEILKKSAFFIDSANLNIAVDMIKTLYSRKNIKGKLTGNLSNPVAGDLKELFNLYEK